MSTDPNQQQSNENNMPGIVTDKVNDIVCSQCGCRIDVSEIPPFSKVECPDCHNVETVPAKLGHFLLINLIGTGGMGGVYYAKDESLGRFVAIKVMLESLGKDQVFIETFRREAQAVAKLNHPNIAQVYSFGMEKGQPYIEMELVGGQRFDKMITSGETLDQGLVMRIGLEIAEALSAADEIGLIHGDIKPENILLDEKGKAKLVDFGLARFADQAADDGIWGTPYYIAPEKVRRQKVDSRSDIYSLGATLWHALTGKPPFDGATPVEVVKARLNKDADPLHIWRKDINDEVENIVMRMLQSQPAKRYPTYNSLLSDLRKIVKDLGADHKNYAVHIDKKTVKLFVSKPKKLSVPISVPADKTGKSTKQSSKTTGSIRGKKRTTGLTVTAGATRNIDEADFPQDAEVEGSALDEYKEKQLTAGYQAEAKKEKASRIGLWFLLAVVVIIVGAVLGKKMRDKQMLIETEQISRIALQDQVKAANEIYTKINVSVTNILAMESTAKSYAEKATNAVLATLNETVDIAPAGQPKRAPLPDARLEQPAPAPKPAPPPPAATKPADGREAPVGLLTLEELERRKAAASAKSSKPAQQAKTAAVAQPAVQPPPNEVKEPNIKTTARRVLIAASKVFEQAQTARQTGATALTLKNETVRATSLYQAQDGVQKLNEFLDSLTAAAAEAKQALADAEQAVTETLALRTKIEKGKKESQEREKKEQQEKDNLRLEEERKAQIQNEIQMVDQAKNLGAVLLAQHKYKELASDLEVQSASYRTDEGKNAVKTLIEKCRRLQALKMFVIERLNTGGFPWGYNDGISTVDVLGANEKEILVRGKAVPWSAISVPQMKRFIDRALSSDKVPSRTLAEQNLAAAIFCSMNGQSDAGKPYANKAVELAPALRDDVKQFLSD
jgi:serine/threonine protein kinase